MEIPVPDQTLDLAALSRPGDQPSPLAKIIVAMVERLPEPHRTVIEGLWWERVSLQTLARRLGRPRQQIAAWRDEALDMLRGMFEDV
jgi:DNA-directed RNA polymerase specialized sigma24 family protein